MKGITPYTKLLYGKTGFTRVYLIFLFLLQNIDCHKAVRTCTCIHNQCKSKNKNVFSFTASENSTYCMGNLAKLS